MAKEMKPPRSRTVMSACSLMRRARAAADMPPGDAADDEDAEQRGHGRLLDWVRGERRNDEARVANDESRMNGVDVRMTKTDAG